MKEQMKSLADGSYDCFATLHIKDGKAVAVLHTTFSLPVGTTIPLLRSDCNLLVESISGSQIDILNGHAII